LVRADVFRIYLPENDIPATALSKLLWRSNKAMRDGIQLSEAITGDGAAIFRHACWMDLEGIVSKRIGSRYVSGRTRAWLKTKNLNFERQ
jgi:bifunctional non-homologous end joining protein LigD